MSAVPRRHLPCRAMQAVPAAMLALLLVGCSDEASVRITGSMDVANPNAQGQSDGGTAMPAGSLGGGPGAGGDTGTAIGAPGTPGPQDAEGGLAAGTREGVYSGTVGEASATFILAADDTLTGLLPTAAGTITLLRGPVGGPLRSWAHDAGVALPPGSLWPLGAAPASVEATLVVQDGVAVTGMLNGASVGLTPSEDGIAPPTSARLAGTWSGGIPLCDSNGDDCSTFRVELAFSDGTFTGITSVLTASGADLFSATLDGSLTRLGDAAIASFVWSTYRYDGALHLLPGEEDRLALFGTTGSELADTPSFAVLLTRLN